MKNRQPNEAASSELNPYAPPLAIEPSEATGRMSWWRFIPASIFLLLGTASFLFGLFAVGMMVYVILYYQSRPPLVHMLAACSLYLGMGISWLLAGSFYLNRRYWRAIVATIIGFVIPLVLFSILGP